MQWVRVERRVGRRCGARRVFIIVGTVSGEIDIWNVTVSFLIDTKKLHIYYQCGRLSTVTIRL